MSGRCVQIEVLAAVYVEFFPGVVRLVAHGSGRKVLRAVRRKLCTRIDAWRLVCRMRRSVRRRVVRRTGRLAICQDSSGDGPRFQTGMA